MRQILLEILRAEERDSGQRRRFPGERHALRGILSVRRQDQRLPARLRLELQHRHGRYLSVRGRRPRRSGAPPHSAIQPGICAGARISGGRSPRFRSETPRAAKRPPVCVRTEQRMYGCGHRARGLDRSFGTAQGSPGGAERRTADPRWVAASSSSPSFRARRKDWCPPSIRDWCSRRTCHCPPRISRPLSRCRTFIGFPAP